MQDVLNLCTGFLLKKQLFHNEIKIENFYFTTENQDSAQAFYKLKN